MPVMAAADTPANAPLNPMATLRDMLQAADARWNVQAAPSAQALRVKKDGFSVRVTSDRSGYLYVLYVGSDNHEFLKLYPSKASELNAIRAGVVFNIPKLWHSEGPAGTDSLLILVTPAPRDFDAVFGQQLAAPATYRASAGLQDALGVCRNGSDQTCPTEQSRNLSATDVADSGSASYGAALLRIDEVAE
jgi:hypothetical protein